MTDGPLVQFLSRLQIALGHADAEFALVGGLAVSIRSEPRFTRDADFAVAVQDDAEAETLVRRLREHGLVPWSVVEHEATGRLATVRLRDDLGNVGDLLFASSGIEEEVVRAATPCDFVGVRLRVALADHLCAMKIVSWVPARPRDLQDFVALWPVSESTRVRRLLRLITERGFARGQDLDAKLARMTADLG